MTREEAIEHGKEQLDVFGGEHHEFIKMAIEALEQDIVLDKITAEIKEMIDYYDKQYIKYHGDEEWFSAFGLESALKIIDKEVENARKTAKRTKNSKSSKSH